MKYILHIKNTGEVADIIATILENQPMIIPTPDPFEIVNTNWGNFTIDDKSKADRALAIFIRDWNVKEIVSQ